MSNYPHIFSPITIGGVTFKNRIWSAPAGTHLLAGQEPYPNEQTIAYYANKARGGTACVTFSAQNMDIYRPQDDSHAHEDIFDVTGHRFWNQLTDSIHFYGAKASLELLAFQYHGYDKSGKLVNYTVNGGYGSKLLTREVMTGIADLYADAAECALACGFDMILIHGGHGLVLSQILSPIFNTRTDEFGGSLENRAKFPIMILDAIRRRVGRRLLIEYRISGSELAGESGFTVSDCIDYLEMIQDRIDIAHISAGSFFSDTEHIMHPNNFLPAGCNTYLAEAVKKSGRIHIPVLTLGGYQRPQDIEAALADGRADLVSMARGTIADAFVPEKARQGREDEIIPCIRCFHCLDYRRAPTFGCSVNPTVGRELRLKFLVNPPERKKRVVVIGGGPAGMQAAFTARQRGHEVILFESSSQLGGKLLFSEQVPFKRDLNRFMHYLINMTVKSGADIRLNTAVTPEEVRALQPDAVIACVGAVPSIPQLPGAENKQVVTAEEVYRLAAAGEPIGERIAVMGGGDVGCETALFLAMELKRSVTLVSRSAQLAKNACAIPHRALEQYLAENVTCLTRSAGVEITAEGLVYETRGTRRVLPCDTVVLAAGYTPLNEAAESFRPLAGEYEFFPAGDCVKADNVRNAVRMGYDSAVQL